MLTIARKKAPIMVALFVGILVVVGLPYTDWWFTGDDFGGLFLGYKTSSWRELLGFFYEGDTNQGLTNPGGQILERSSFLSVYYRPLYCIFLGLQYWAFGTHGYSYLLCNVVVHAASTALLFRIFSFFATLSTAAGAALLFALHPQVAYRFGAIVNFHYYVNVLLVLLITLSLKKYCNSGSRTAYGAALLLYAISLLTRETTLVLPAIIGLGMLLYRAPVRDWRLIYQFPRAVLYGLPFGLVACGYLCLRLYLYPLKSFAAHSNFLPYALQGGAVATKVQELLVMLYDFLWLSWLPWGNRQLKLAALLLLAGTLAWLWWRCREKLGVLICFLSAGLMLWPGLISFYSPRYFYEAAPFVLAGFILLMHAPGESCGYKRLLRYALWCFVAALAPFTVYNFVRREKKLSLMREAVEELVATPGITKQPLCFLTTPNDGFAGGYNPHIFWILFNNRWQQIFCDADIAITQGDSNIVSSTRWCMVASDYWHENYVQISQIQGGFHITSSNPDKVLFVFTTPPRGFGKKTVIAQAKNSRGETGVSDFVLYPNSQLRLQKPWYAWWDYHRKKFGIIRSP